MPGIETVEPDTAQSPLVSILMPAYRHEKFVEQAVRSVWDQTYRNIELLVCDDHSPDGTYARALALADESPIPMRMFRNEANLGITGTLNFLLGQARGEWIALLPSDDFYHPDFIEENMRAALAASRWNICIHSDAVLVNEAGEEFGYESIFRKPPLQGRVFGDIAEKKGRIVPPTFFTSRSIYEACGGFDETMRAEDFDFHLRAARRAEFVYMDRKLLFKREVKNSLGNSTSKWADDLLRALEKHLDFDPALVSRALRSQNLRLIWRCALLDDQNGASRLTTRYRRTHGILDPRPYLYWVSGNLARVIRRILGSGTVSKVARRLGIRRLPLP